MGGRLRWRLLNENRGPGSGYREPSYPAVYGPRSTVPYLCYHLIVPKKQLIIGLTGPIASGKNEAVKILKRLGAFVIDADKIGHRVLNKEKNKIAAVFGNEVILKNGSVDRKKLANIVFNKSAYLKKLNKLTHPEILNVIKSIIKSSRKKIIVINAAVLRNIGLLKITDFVVSILANRDVRINRLVKKSFTRKNALLRMNSQMSDAEYKNIADITIYNNADLKDLKRKITLIFRNYLLNSK